MDCISWAYRLQKRCKMRKDFVKKTEPNRRSRISKREDTLSIGKISSNLKWYLAGIASGIVMSLLAYLFSLPEDKRKISSEIPKSKNSPAAISMKQKRTQFEFYDILPEKSSKYNKNRLGAEGNKDSGEDQSYFLQAGAFKKKKDAEVRRAELVLLDLDPPIKLAQEKNGSLYRITIGPFVSLLEAKKVQKLVADEGIKTLLKRRFKK